MKKFVLLICLLPFLGAALLPAKAQCPGENIAFSAGEDL